MQADIYQVFVSSPGDLTREREVISQVTDELSRLVGREKSFRFEVLDWVTDVPSGTTSRPQELVNKSIGSDFSIYLGMVCSKFGTNTEVAGSGTEEEYDLALERRKSHGTIPELIFFFKDPRQSPTPLDPEDLVKISAFKKRIREDVLTHDFASLEELRTFASQALLSAVEKLRSANSSALQHGDHHQSATTENEGALLSQTNDDEDFGILDYVEVATDSMNLFTEQLEGMNNSVNRLAKAIEKVNAESANTSENPAAAKRIIDQFAAELSVYSTSMSSHLTNAKACFQTTTESTRNAVILAIEDGFETKQGLQASMAGVFDLRNTLLTIPEAVRPLQTEMIAFPRLTRDFNKGKRGAIQSNDDVIEFTLGAVRQIDAIDEILRE